MKLLRLSSYLRLCLAIATCLVFGADPTPLAAQSTFADVAGVTGCSPNTSNATPAVVTCGTVGLGSTGGFADAQYGVVGASASSGSATANVISIAQFGDQTTFFAPPAALTLGITVALDGTITGVGNGAQGGGKFSMSSLDTTCAVQMTQNTPGEAFASKTCFFSVMPNSVNTLGFLGTLEAFAKFGTGVVADFSQTAKITAVGFYDANQNLISPATLIGDSGTVYGVSTIQVPVDIKPQSCPNPFNTAARGELPVAILGTASFDVTTVDPSSVKLQGVPALRSSLEDVGTPFTGPLVSPTSCTSAGADGFTDMVLHFSDRAVSDALGPTTSGQMLVLTLTGNLLPEFGGTAITGQDVVVIVP